MSITSNLRFFLLALPVLGIVGLVVAATPQTLDNPQPAPVQAPEPAPARIETPQERAFELKLEEVGASLDGTVGIAVVDVESGALYEFNGDELLPQQSVSKLWVAMTALSKVDAGELDLAEPVCIRREDLTLFHQPIREIATARGFYDTDYSDLLTRALTQSDNTANDRLLRRAGGPEAVEKWLAANKVS